MTSSCSVRQWSNKVPLLLPAEGGALVGGYNARGWSGIGEDRDSPASFLFTWRDGDYGQRPVKLPKVRHLHPPPKHVGMPLPSLLALPRRPRD